MKARKVWLGSVQYPFVLRIFGPDFSQIKRMFYAHFKFSFNFYNLHKKITAEMVFKLENVLIVRLDFLLSFEGGT